MNHCILFNVTRSSRPPQHITLSLLLLTLISSTAGLIQSYTPQPALAITHLTSLHASRLSVPCLGVFLILQQHSPRCYPTSTTNVVLLLVGPMFSLTTLLLLFTPYSPSHFLVFGPTQDILSLVVNFIALIPSLICLVILSRPITKRSPHCKTKEETQKFNTDTCTDPNATRDKESNNDDENNNVSDSEQLQHTALLILLAISMFSSIALSLHRSSQFPLP